MKIARGVATGVLLAGAFAFGAWAQKAGLLSIGGTRYLKLTAPLELSPEGKAGAPHALPPGTALYKDQAYAEGHVRYIVYVNIKGGFQAEQVASDKSHLIDPLWAYPAAQDSGR